MNDRRLAEQVRIVGSGLLGASIGLGLRAHGVDVILEDASPSACSLAIDYGAGRAAARRRRAAASIVVAVPPDVDGRRRRGRARRGSRMRWSPMSRASRSRRSTTCDRRGADLSRYLGSHPMAGRERGGAISARADLFIGRPWVVAGHDGITLPTRRPDRAHDPRPRRGADRDGRRTSTIAASRWCRTRRSSWRRCSRARLRDGSAAASASPARACATRRASRRATRSSGCRSSGANARPVADILRPLPRRSRRACWPRSTTPDAPESRRVARRRCSRPATTGVVAHPRQARPGQALHRARRQDRRQARRARPAAHRDRRGEGQHGGPAPRALARDAGRVRRDLGAAARRRTRSPQRSRRAAGR